MEQTTPKAVQIFKSTDGIYAVPDKRTTDEKTADGFQNFAAKIGVGSGPFGRPSNLISQGHYTPNLITRNRLQLEYAYRGSWIAGKVIDCPAEDMTREGIALTTNEEAEKVTDFQVAMTKLNIMGAYADAIRWGRLYGGAVGVYQIKGQNLSTPLKVESVGKGQFLGITVYDRWQIWPCLTELIDEGPEMGLPKYYDLVLGTNLNNPGQEPGFAAGEVQNTGRVRIHHTRLFRMGGHKLPFYQAITEMLWDESILERMWDRLIAFDDATMNAFGLIHVANLRYIKFENLREIMAAGGEAEKGLRAQVEFMRQMQSNEGITATDKNDDVETQSYSFAGIPDLLLQAAQQTAGAADIPLIRLFCQSPAGLNATGDSDLRMYYDGIKLRQVSKMTLPMDITIKLLWLSEFGKPAPKDLQFTFVPLWQLSAPDRATMAKTTTDTILAAETAGVITPAIALKELKQAAPETNLFTHITDEDIENAEDMPPLAPDEEQSGEEPSEEERGKVVKIKKAAGDALAGSTWSRFLRSFTRDKKSGLKVSQQVAVAPGVQSQLKPVPVVKTTDHKRIKDWLAKNQ